MAWRAAHAVVKAIGGRNAGFTQVRPRARLIQAHPVRAANHGFQRVERSHWALPNGSWAAPPSQFTQLHPAVAQRGVHPAVRPKYTVRPVPFDVSQNQQVPEAVGGIDALLAQLLAAYTARHPAVPGF